MRVITLHGLGEPPSDVTASEAEYWIDADRFRRLMDRILDFDDYRITFDDGNRSDFEIATPALQRRGLRATFFIPSDRLGDPTSLTPDELRAMVDAGMEIGSHGTLHRPWSELSRGELDDELSRSKRVLSEIIGQEVNQASCPFGRYNRVVLRALREHGYRRVYTSDGGWVAAQSWLVPRRTIMRDDALVVGSDAPDVLDRLLRPRPLTAVRQQARQVYRRLKYSL